MVQTNNALDWLKKMQGAFPALGIVLYVRSGTGYSGPNAEHANPALSQESSALSRAFGALLTDRLAAVVSAPGNTSMETARCIREGAGISSTVREDPGIGDPSLYITDLPLAEKETFQFPKEVARQALLAGILRERAAWATKDPTVAARTIQATLVASIQPGKVTVFVAPSVAIAATVGVALGLEARIGYIDCPKFLEGAVIFRGPRGDVWVWMGSHAGRSVL